MDDVKDKVKGFMKKVNKPFSSSSSSGKFKGQGRVLGSSSSSSNSIPTLTPRPNLNPNPNPKPKPKPTSPIASSDHSRTDNSSSRKPEGSGDGFDPFDSLVTSSKRSQNGYSLNDVYECPICKQPFISEEEVSEHVDSCLTNTVERELEVVESNNDNNDNSSDELEVCVGTYVSGKPSEGSVDVVLKLLSNIGREPENAKFRRIRMSNPKIKEAVADVTGGIELLSFLGFQLREENGETWAVMETPTEEQGRLIKKAIVLLESQLVQEPPKSDNLGSTSTTSSAEKDAEAETIQPKKVHRQVKIILVMLLKGGCGENELMIWFFVCF